VRAGHRGLQRVDDDCDEAVDEGCVLCDAPAPEVCNQVDDDCDGVVGDGWPGDRELDRASATSC
jgi:hypothetical protein